MGRDGGGGGREGWRREGGVEEGDGGVEEGEGERGGGGREGRRRERGVEEGEAERDGGGREEGVKKIDVHRSLSLWSICYPKGQDGLQDGEIFGFPLKGLY